MKITNEVITSRKNPLVMLAASLNEKKYREEYKLFVAPGYKLYREAILSKAPIAHVILEEGFAAEHRETIMRDLSGEEYRDTQLSVFSAGCFEKITAEKSPEGVILLIKHLDISKKYYKINNRSFFEDSGRMLFLSSIRDPGNLGTILRSAGAFGVDSVLISEDCADLYHPRAVRAAMGALFRVGTVRVPNSPEIVRELQSAGYRVFAAELREGALPLSELVLSARDVVIIGNEGHGIPLELSDVANASVYIPIAEEAESLNAAAAATIFLFEQAK